MNSGAPEIALNVANGILNTKPYDVPALLTKADALYGLGLFAMSSASYQEVLKIKSADPAAHLGMGRIKLSEHDPHAAEAEFRAALRSETEPGTVSNLGISLDLQNRPVEAQVEYRRALALDPNSTATRINLARSLLSTGDLEGARAAMSPVVAARPNDLLSADIASVQRSIGQQGAGVTAETMAIDEPAPSSGLAPVPLYAPASSGQISSESNLGPTVTSAPLRTVAPAGPSTPTTARVRRVR